MRTWVVHISRAFERLPCAGSLAMNAETPIFVTQNYLLPLVKKVLFNPYILTRVDLSTSPIDQSLLWLPQTSLTQKLSDCYTERKSRGIRWAKLQTDELLRFPNNWDSRCNVLQSPVQTDQYTTVRESRVQERIFQQLCRFTLTHNMPPGTKKVPRNSKMKRKEETKHNKQKPYYNQGLLGDQPRLRCNFIAAPVDSNVTKYY